MKDSDVSTGQMSCIICLGSTLWITGSHTRWKINCESIQSKLLKWYLDTYLGPAQLDPFTKEHQVLSKTPWYFKIFHIASKNLSSLYSFSCYSKLDPRWEDWLVNRKLHLPAQLPFHQVLWYNVCEILIPWYFSWHMYKTHVNWKNNFSITPQ